MARPSPGTAIALVALAVALPGSAVADPVVDAAQRLIDGDRIKPNSITHRQIARNAIRRRHVARNAITTRQVRNGSLLAVDFRAGELPSGAAGPKGDAGAQGLQGVPGTARAFGVVSSAGVVDQARSKNITVTKLPAFGNGAYCVIPAAGSAIDVAGVLPVVTADFNDGAGSSHIAMVRTAANSCGASLSGWRVDTQNFDEVADNWVPTDIAFTVVIP